MYCVGPAFNYLDAPVIRLSGVDVPMPYAKALEETALPSVAVIADAVRRILKNKMSAVSASR